MSLPQPYYDDGEGIVIYHGETREILPELDKVDMIFTDPPYGLVGGNEDPAKELMFNGVYRVKPSGEVTLLTRYLTFPNGIALSPDETTAYVAVSDNPFFAVTDKDGNFKITGLPAGTYTIEAFHEKTHRGGAGVTQKITVGADDKKSADFVVEVKAQ